jgi:hypothetical protein
VWMDEYNQSIGLQGRSRVLFGLDSQRSWHLAPGTTSAESPAPLDFTLATTSTVSAGSLDPAQEGTHTLPLQHRPSLAEYVEQQTGPDQISLLLLPFLVPLTTCHVSMPYDARSAPNLFACRTIHLGSSVSNFACPPSNSSTSQNSCMLNHLMLGHALSFD